MRLFAVSKREESMEDKKNSVEMGQKNEIVQNEPATVTEQNLRPFQKGVSGNTKGRPRKLPPSGRLRSKLESPAPTIVRRRVERAMNTDRIKNADGTTEIVLYTGKDAYKCPKKFSWDDAYTELEFLAGAGIETGYRPEIRYRALREEDTPVETREPLTVDGVKKTLYEHFAEVAIERARIFKMPMPHLQELADEAGIGDELGIPREDKDHQT
jgi:hypothetical protein